MLIQKFDENLTLKEIFIKRLCFFDILLSKFISCTMCEIINIFSPLL